MVLVQKRYDIIAPQGDILYLNITKDGSAEGQTIAIPVTSTGTKVGFLAGVSNSVSGPWDYGVANYNEYTPPFNLSGGANRPYACRIFHVYPEGSDPYGDGPETVAYHTIKMCTDGTITTTGQDADPRDVTAYTQVNVEYNDGLGGTANSLSTVGMHFTAENGDVSMTVTIDATVPPDETNILGGDGPALTIEHQFTDGGAWTSKLNQDPFGTGGAGDIQSWSDTDIPGNVRVTLGSDAQVTFFYDGTYTFTTGTEINLQNPVLELITEAPPTVKLKLQSTVQPDGGAP